MTRLIAVLLLVSGTLLAGGPAGAQGPPPEAPYARTPAELIPYSDYGGPYRMLFREPLAFRGVGRGKAPPEGLTEIRLGLLAPPQESPEWREGLSMARGVGLAVEEANAAGGHQGLPYRLMHHPDLPVWGASSNEIVDMAWEERVWAILGSVSGDSSHIAIRVALKAEVPVMNTATTDPTFTETGIPWAFRCIADDRQQSYALARYIFGTLGLERVAALRSNDRYGRFGIAELRDAAKRLGHPFVHELNWLARAEDYTPLLERIRAAEPDGVVIWGPPEGAAKALIQLRAMGLDVPVFGSAALLDPRFIEAAGPAADGLVVAATFDPTSGDPVWQAFRRRYRARWDEEPDAFAAHAYDGTRLVLRAIEEVGLNRPLIRDFLAALREVDGVTGKIVFDNTSNDIGPVPLAVFRDGAFRFGEVTVDGSEEPGEEPVVGLLRPIEGEGRELGAAVERGLRLAFGGMAVPPRLVVRGVRGPWTGVGEVARDLIEDDGAAVLVSALDSAGSHVAAQVATRLRRPILVTADLSPLLHHTGVPWIHFLDEDVDDAIAEDEREVHVGVLAASQVSRLLWAD